MTKEKYDVYGNFDDDVDVEDEEEEVIELKDEFNGVSKKEVVRKLVKNAPSVASELEKKTKKKYNEYDFNEIMADYHSGDAKRVNYAKECALAALEGVSRSIIQKRYSSYATKYFEDLDQSGKLGILKSLERYDASKGAASTFAYPYIVHEMQIYIDSFVSRTTPHYSSNIRKIKKAIVKLGMIKKNDVTTVDIAQETGLTMEAVEQALTILNYTDEVHYDNCTDAFLNDNLDHSRSCTPEDEYIEKEKMEVLKKAFNSLSSEEQKVISLEFGLDSSSPRSHKEVSCILGIPLDKVKRLNAEALRKLRHSDLRFSHFDYIENSDALSRLGTIPTFNAKINKDEILEIIKNIEVNF